MTDPAAYYRAIARSTTNALGMLAPGAQPVLVAALRAIAAGLAALCLDWSLLYRGA